MLLSWVMAAVWRHIKTPLEAPPLATAQIAEFTPESGAITMFSTEWCGYCKRLKVMLDATGIPYTEVDIENTPGTPELVEQVNGGNRTVPTVVFPDGSTETNPSLNDVKAKLGL